MRFVKPKTIKITITLFAVLLFSFWAPSRVFALDDRSFLERAETYRKQGAYLEAIGVYRALQEMTADREMRALAHLEIAGIYSRALGALPQALAEYRALIRGFSASKYVPQALFFSGMALHEMGRTREAREAFALYLARYPDGQHREIAAFMSDILPGVEGIKEDRNLFVGPAENETIRVLLGRTGDRVIIGAGNLLSVSDRQGNLIAAESSRVTIELRQRNISVNEKASGSDRLVIRDDRGGLLSYDGRLYRGSLLIKAAPEGLKIINELPLESYLYGVVPREMPPRWPLEALKAQAVAARTFAFYLKQRAGDRSYHLCATTMSQVYHGAGFETENTNRAVDETRGQILFYQGLPALTYFHAHSGGVTEAPEYVWSTSVPYMKSISDEFSLLASPSVWTATFDFETLRRSLGRTGIELGPITGIEPLEWSPSGRLTRLRILHQEGERVLGGNIFRLLVDPQVIRSTMFTIDDNGGVVTMKGRGHGHGVGMSQWGARVMGQKGFSYREILAFYYPELELR